MGALVRCGSCGELRWDILALSGRPEAGTCEVCGKPLSLERRRPGRRFMKSRPDERRDHHPIAAPPA